jgi:hypothetical protein
LINDCRSGTREAPLGVGEEEADDWLPQVGWRKLERKPLAGPASVIVAEAV